ncbi:MAG: hypothetical protein H7301_12180 [Cryobacterium sp.]|nr:hypothetical protein [Oligoflexia bacterium]
MGAPKLFQDAIPESTLFEGPKKCVKVHIEADGSAAVSIWRTEPEGQLTEVLSDFRLPAEKAHLAFFWARALAADPLD